MHHIHQRIPFWTVAMAVLGALVFWRVLPGELAAIREQEIGFPDSDIKAHQVRPFILAALCALPLLATIAYALGDRLDRYLTRQFLGIFSICLGALISIWMLIDLSDKVSDFRDSASPWITAGIYYSTRFPAIVLFLLPYSMLLSLLYAFGKLSAQREVIAVIQAGRSIVRMAAPMIITGLFCTVAGICLNYHWAPMAEGQQRDILAQATGKMPSEASRVLYRSREHRRLWLIGSFPPDYQLGKPLRDVEVTLTHPDFSLASRITSPSVAWNPDNQAWTFHDAVVATFPTDSAPVFEPAKETLVIDDWSETPWQLIKPGLSPAYLGIPDLNSWLLSFARHPGFADPSPYLTHWHYRWALPFACLITVLLAAPLSIHFARRGPGGSIFLAIVLSALMLLASNISLALGESGLVRPILAAWLPNLIFGLIGLYLFHRRISGRPVYQSLARVLFPTQG